MLEHFDSHRGAPSRIDLPEVLKSESPHPERQPLWQRLRGIEAWRAFLGSPLRANAAMMVIWVLCWQLGRLVEYTEHASIWYPVAGLTFAILLLTGARLVPGLFAGCVIVTIWVGRHYGVQLGDLELSYAGALYAVAHLGSYAIGAHFLRLIAIRGKRELPKLVVGFLLIAAISSLLATVTGIAALVVSGMMPVSEVATTWLPYWIGDMAGVVVLAPFFGALLCHLDPDKSYLASALAKLNRQQATPRFKFKLLFVLGMLAACMLLAYFTRSPNSAFAIFFLVIPYMWIASTESAFCNVLTLAMGSTLIALLVHVLGLKDFVMVYQFAINVLAANTLFALALPSLLADNHALRQITESDTLTQAASRAHLEQRARMDIEHCRSAGQPLAVIVFDIDHFKHINDHHGHALGDKALQHVCQIAQQALRPTDLLGRFGGDEFVALLPGNDGQAAFGIAERMRLHLERSAGEEGMALTASFGIAELGEADTYNSLFERADRALYRAKHEGRNRVAGVPATPPDPHRAA